MAKKYPNVYIDTSVYKMRRYPKELVEYVLGPGGRKVLFGSNYPGWPAKYCLEDYEMLAHDGEIEKLFLYENAERVFKIGSTG